MYPLIFAWKPLFLQVLCDADCFHISVVQQCCCLDIYRCGLTGKDRTVGYVSRGNLAF